MYKMYNLMEMNVEWKYLNGKCVDMIGFIGIMLEIFKMRGIILENI